MGGVRPEAHQKAAGDERLRAVGLRRGGSCSRKDNEGGSSAQKLHRRVGVASVASILDERRWKVLLDGEAEVADGWRMGKSSPAASSLHETEGNLSEGSGRGRGTSSAGNEWRDSPDSTDLASRPTVVDGKFFTEKAQINDAWSISRRVLALGGRAERGTSIGSLGAY